jgi:hypothetical protein
VQYWERVSTAPRAEVILEQDICTMAATSIRVRQNCRNLFGRFLRFRKPTDGQAWLLPNGESAEQCGERQTDLLLVWAEDEASTLDDAAVRSRWPESERLQKLGKNLFLLAGPGLQRSRNEAGQVEP